VILASPSVVHGGCGWLTVTLLPFLLQTKFVNDALEKENDALERENERLDQHAQLLEQLSARVADSGCTLTASSSLSLLLSSLRLQLTMTHVYFYVLLLMQWTRWNPC